MFKLKKQKKEIITKVKDSLYSRGITKFNPGDLIQVIDSGEWYTVDHVAFEGDTIHEKVWLRLVTDNGLISGRFDYLPDRYWFKILTNSSYAIK